MSGSNRSGSSRSGSNRSGSSWVNSYLASSYERNTCKFLIGRLFEFYNGKLVMDAASVGWSGGETNYRWNTSHETDFLVEVGLNGFLDHHLNSVDLSADQQPPTLRLISNNGARYVLPVALEDNEAKHYIMFEVSQNAKLWKSKLAQLERNLSFFLQYQNISVASFFAAGIALPADKSAKILGELEGNPGLYPTVYQLFCGSRLLFFLQPQNALEIMQTGISDVRTSVAGLETRMEVSVGEVRTSVVELQDAVTGLQAQMEVSVAGLETRMEVSVGEVRTSVVGLQDAVAGLQAQMEAREGRMEASVGEVRTSVVGLQDAVTGLQAQMEARDARIEAVMAMIQEFIQNNAVPHKGK